MTRKILFKIIAVEVKASAVAEREKLTSFETKRRRVSSPGVSWGRNTGGHIGGRRSERLDHLFADWLSA